MHYTINIDDSDPMAKSIINMLKEFAKTHSFVDISASENEIQKNIAEELDARLDYIQKNPYEGDSWENVKKRLLSKGAT